MDIPKRLEKFGLVKPTVPKRRRLVCTSEGGPGVGKTDFFYRTFPKPSLTINIDLNDEGVTEKYADKDVLVKRVPVPAEHDKARDRGIFDELMELYETSVAGDWFRSVMIDEGAALYTLCRRAFLDGLDFGEADQKDYTPINSRMSRFYTLAKQERFNLYIPHRQKKERARVKNPRSGKWGSEETGRMIYSGWKDALYESQCHLLMRKDPQKNSKGKLLSKFEAEIVKCTANSEIEGRVLFDDDINLPNLGELVFPQSDAKDWL